MAYTDAQLFSLSQKGLIAGPGESEKDFTKRVDYCLNLKKFIADDLQENIPFALESFEEGEAIVSESISLTKPLYDIAPEWIPCFFSNKDLAVWHGGCAWIFQKDDNSPTSAFLQLRKSWQTKKKIFGLYNRKEVLAHELSHVGRMMFTEPRFEEMSAYQSSSSCFQRTFGPIVRSSSETMMFLLTIFIIFLLDIMVLATGYAFLFQTIIWLKLVPLAMVFFALIRLWKARKTYFSCLKNITELTGSKEKALAIVYRLTDQEIGDFSRTDPEELRKKMKKNQMKETRWRQIYAYFLL